MERLVSSQHREDGLHDPQTFLFPCLCFLTTSLCCMIVLFTPHTPIASPDREGRFVFKYRTPLWILQILLVIQRFLLTFEVTHIFSIQILIPFSTLMAIIFDNYHMSESKLKVRCWLALYFLLLIYTLWYLQNTWYSILSCICSICILILSILRSTFPFQEYHQNPPNAEYTCNLLSYLSFTFLNENLVQPAVQSKQLEMKNIPNLCDFDTCAYVWNQYQQHYQSKASLSWNIFRVVAVQWYIQGFFAFIYSLLIFVPPLALQKLLFYLSEEQLGFSYMSYRIPLLLLFLIICPLLASICENLHNNYGRHVGIQTRALIQSLLYAKLLKLDPNIIHDGAGRLNNLISTDVLYILNFTANSHQIWMTCLQICTCVFLLYQTLGLSSMGGVAVLFVCLPLGGIINEKYAN